MQELEIIKAKVEDKKVKHDYSKEFEVFYSAYPRHKGKQDAFRVFKRIKPAKELLDRMIEAIEEQRQEKKLKEKNKMFVEDWPFPSTWLYQQRWEDESDIVKANKIQSVIVNKPTAEEIKKAEEDGFKRMRDYYKS